MANYLIIGGDGKEYGPVTETDVRLWIIEGRLNAQSLAKAESDAEFRALAQFPEFAGVWTPPPPATIAPVEPATDFRERDYELDLGGCISRGYQLLKDNFNLLFLTALAFAGIQVLIVLLGMIPLVGMIFSLGDMVIGGPLLGGVYLVSLRALRRQPAEVGDMFAGFRQGFGQLFLGRLVPGLIAGVCLIPVLVAAVLMLVIPAVTQHIEPDPKKLLILIPFFLIGLIPMIYLQTCWIFTLPLIIDKQMDFWTAMKTSWTMVNKHWWQVFGLTLLIGLVNLVSIIIGGVIGLIIGFIAGYISTSTVGIISGFAVGGLTCAICCLFTIPIGFAALMIAYETIFGAEKN